MADIKPLRAWRYNESLSASIEDLTSPLFDVVSEKQRKALYENPYNSIHLSVPMADHPDEYAASLLLRWKEKGILAQDNVAGIYVYYQYFRVHGIPQEYCRKGFICHIRVHDWSDNVILRHENTIPKSVNDRIALLAKTQFQVSATHGLYTDTALSLERYMDEAIKTPLYETEDYQGVRDVLAVINDPSIIQQFVEVVKKQKIVLADGHHRYESSLVHMHRRTKENPHHTGEEGYNFHLMYLTNTEGSHLRILPTHRLIRSLGHLTADELVAKLEKNFIIKPVEDATSLDEIIAGKRWTFGIALPDRAFKVRLKPEALANNPWPFPDIIKALDLTVMHYFIIEDILGIPGRDQRRSEVISFERNFFECLEKVHHGQEAMAIFTNEVTIEEVKEVCASGYTMPQKSTYFYPKVICGLMFSSILASEF